MHAMKTASAGDAGNAGNARGAWGAWGTGDAMHTMNAMSAADIERWLADYVASTPTNQIDVSCALRPDIAMGTMGHSPLSPGHSGAGETGTGDTPLFGMSASRRLHRLSMQHDSHVRPT